MSYSSSNVANVFWRLAKTAKRPVTNMSLQKLVYIAHGYSLARDQGPLITDNVNAFPYGPVIPILYNRLRKYGGSPVTVPIPEPPELISEPDKKNIDDVWKDYGHLNGIQLSVITHKKNTPWSLTWEQDKYGVIPNERIRDHYIELLNARAIRI